ncbi:hypothetical protein Bca4012_050079 [Brassica carinata]
MDERRGPYQVRRESRMEWQSLRSPRAMVHKLMPRDTRETEEERIRRIKGKAIRTEEYDKLEISKHDGGIQMSSNDCERTQRTSLRLRRNLKIIQLLSTKHASPPSRTQPPIPEQTRKMKTWEMSKRQATESSRNASKNSGTPLGAKKKKGQRTPDKKGISVSKKLASRGRVSPRGKLIRTKIIVDRETGRSRGFAFVTFTSNQEATNAMQLDRQHLHGRRIRVNFATERGSGFGGRGFGGPSGGAVFYDDPLPCGYREEFSVLCH